MTVLEAHFWRWMVFCMWLLAKPCGDWHPKGRLCEFVEACLEEGEDAMIVLALRAWCIRKERQWKRRSK